MTRLFTFCRDMLRFSWFLVSHPCLPFRLAQKAQDSYGVPHKWKLPSLPLALVAVFLAMWIRREKFLLLCVLLLLASCSSDHTIRIEDNEHEKPIPSVSTSNPSTGETTLALNPEMNAQTLATLNLQITNNQQLALEKLAITREQIAVNARLSEQESLSHERLTLAAMAFCVLALVATCALCVGVVFLLKGGIKV